MVGTQRKPLRAALLLVAMVLGMVLGLLLIFAPSSSAHAELDRTIPESGANLDQSPPEITLAFGESVRIPTGGIRLINESSERVATPSPKASDEGRVQTVDLPELEAGAYVVSWRAVSADGHPIRGAFTFRVGGTGDQAAVARLAEKLLGSGGGPAGLGFTLAVLRFCAFLSLIVLVGGIGYVRFVRTTTTTQSESASDSHGAAEADRRARSLTRAAMVICALSGVALVVLYGPYVGGYGFGAVTDGTLLDDTLNDSVGRAIIGRTVALVLLGVVLTQLFQARPGTLSTIGRQDDPSTDGPAGAVHPLGVAAMVCGAAALVAQVFAGHGHTGPNRTLAAVFTIVHTGSTSLWIGGLAFVVATAIVGRAASDMSTDVSSDVSSRHAEQTLRRFSPLALAAVIAMVVSGVFAAWRQVGSVQAARETTYGQLLLAKTAVVAALLVLGGLARRRLQATSGGPLPAVTTSVRRRLLLEVILSAVVIGLTALLVNVAPAREVVAKPVALRLQTESMNIDITVDPARRGVNAIHIYALTKTGAQQTIDHAALTATHESGIEPLELRVLRAGPNHFQVLNADLPLKGRWTLRVIVGRDQFTEEEVSAQITLK